VLEYDPGSGTFRQTEEFPMQAELEEEQRVLEEWEAAGRPAGPHHVVTAEIAERARREG
jgi:hypothetical protein